MSGYIGNIPTPQATQTRETFTATASQTTFNTAGYTPGFVDVWLNGVKLVNGDDFTATNGSDVVLTVGAASGDTVEVLSFSTFEVNSQTFTGDTSAVNLNVTGTFTSRGIDDNADATAITIDSSENVFVGRTSDSFGTVGSSYRANGSISATASANEVLDLNRLSTDGNIMRFFKDGTTVGSIGHDDTSSATHKRTYIGYGDTGLAFIPTLNEIVGHNTSTNASNSSITLGDQNVPFENLYLSGGVYLGGTGAANKLDDYEEGTWTPGINGITVSSNHGRYRKIGSLVIAAYTIRFPTSSSTSPIQITGLPFTNMNDGAGGANLPNFGAALGYTNQGSYFGHHVNNNDTTVTAYSLDGTFAQISQWSNKDIRNVIFYFTDA